MSLPWIGHLPEATALYLSLYAISWVVHMVPMAYVLAGSGWLAAQMWIRWIGRRSTVQPSEQILRDWLPFFLGVTITAGVAPLLFLQILYQENFYTANLLLLHRWMAMLPVLMGGFYLLYVAKTAWFARARASIQTALSTLACLAFMFVAATWTENHLLSLRGLPVWVRFYADQKVFYADPALGWRWGLWLGSAASIMATVLLTQLRSMWGPDTAHLSQPEAGPGRAVLSKDMQRLAAFALLGSLCAIGCLWRYPWDAAELLVLRTPQARVGMGVGCVGLVLQLALWWRLFRTGRSTRATRATRATRGALGGLWAGMVLSLGAIVLLREEIRWAHMDVASLYARHAQAAQVDGMAVFIGCGLINAFFVAWCIRMVMRRTLPSGPAVACAATSLRSAFVRRCPRRLPRCPWNADAKKDVPL